MAFDPRPSRRGFAAAGASVLAGATVGCLDGFTDEPVAVLASVLAVNETRDPRTLRVTVERDGTTLARGTHRVDARGVFDVEASWSKTGGSYVVAVED